MVSLNDYVEACRQAKATGGEVRITSEGTPYNTKSGFPRFMSQLVRWVRDRCMPRKSTEERQAVARSLNAYILKNNLEQATEGHRIRTSGSTVFLEDLGQYLDAAKRSRENSLRPVVWKSYFDIFNSAGESGKAEVSASERRRNFEIFCQSIHSGGNYNDTKGELPIHYLHSAFVLSGYKPEGIKGKVSQLKSMRAGIPAGEVSALIDSYHDIGFREDESVL